MRSISGNDDAPVPARPTNVGYGRVVTKHKPGCERGDRSTGKRSGRIYDLVSETSSWDRLEWLAKALAVETSTAWQLKAGYRTQPETDRQHAVAMATEAYAACCRLHVWAYEKLPCTCHTLRETQQTISDWVVSAFGPTGTNLRVAIRAQEELTELLACLSRDDNDPHAV